MTERKNRLMTIVINLYTSNILYLCVHVTEKDYFARYFRSLFFYKQLNFTRKGKDYFSRVIILFVFFDWSLLFFFSLCSLKK